jgi:hypothetical protein
MTAPAPGHVAIIGAGPIGLDAALACADRGWPCTVYEVGAIAGANVRAWQHVRMFTPWEMNLSSRMRAHLPALPGPAEHFPSGAELVDGLLAPIAALPAVAGSLRLSTRVLGVGREGLLKHEAIGAPERRARPFRLLVVDPDGVERVERADLVLDCTGSYGRANTLGDGGIPAPGERSLADRIVRTIPDVDALAGRSVLLVGAGKSAQTAARDLAALVRTQPGTRVLWAVRSAAPDWGAVPEDPLPQRRELVQVAAALHAGELPGVQVRTGVVVEALAPAGEAVAVTLRGATGTDEVVVDRVVGLTGYVGDSGLYRQLQVHECYAAGAPMNLAAALLAAAGDGPADCLAQQPVGVDVLRSPEPNFFVLGVKSYGRNSSFLLRVGYEQVDEVAAAYAAVALEV